MNLRRTMDVELSQKCTERQERRLPENCAVRQAICPALRFEDHLHESVYRTEYTSPGFVMVINSYLMLSGLLQVDAHQKPYQIGLKMLSGSRRSSSMMDSDEPGGVTMYRSPSLESAILKSDIQPSRSLSPLLKLIIMFISMSLEVCLSVFQFDGGLDLRLTSTSSLQPWSKSPGAAIPRP